MRIGLITLHRSRNYGALLQAYALRQALTEMGHEVELIDYRRPDLDGFPYGISKHPRRFLPSVMKVSKLAAFRRRHLPTAAARYVTDADFQARPPQFDAYICGSDQIWNATKGFYPAYFLHFAPEDSARLVAYAPSFGDYTPGSEHDEEIVRLLGRFHSLSAREQEGVEIIARLTGRPAEHVLDPSLLRDDYAPLCIPPREPGEFVVVYATEVSRGVVALVRQARRHFGLPVLSLGKQVPGADEIRTGMGVEEWLGYLQAARFVCTNAFHGTALSILFRREFLTARHSTRNTRLSCLLESLGLLGRQVTDPDAPGAFDALGEQVSFDDAHANLQRLRAASLDYLRRALEG